MGCTDIARYVDLRSMSGTDMTRRLMSLDVFKVLFGYLSLVRAPTFFSSRTKALWMAGGYPVNACENGNFNLGCGSFPV